MRWRPHVTLNSLWRFGNSESLAWTWTSHTRNPMWHYKNTYSTKQLAQKTSDSFSVRPGKDGQANVYGRWWGRVGQSSAGGWTVGQSTDRLTGSYGNLYCWYDKSYSHAGLTRDWLPIFFCSDWDNACMVCLPSLIWWWSVCIALEHDAFPRAGTEAIINTKS